MLFEKHTGKLVYLSPGIPLNWDHEDEADERKPSGRNETDQLPREINVTSFDLCFYLFSMLTYVVDVISDCAVAYTHYIDGRVWSGIFIALFSLLPSIILNLVAFLWMVDDGYRHKNRKGWKGDALLCLLQVGPLTYYWRCFTEGVGVLRAKNERAKRKHFKGMVAAERDATLLRFFEAFMESAPQLLMQGLLLTSLVWGEEATHELPRWATLQAASIFTSLLSIAWSISIQHRALRISRADKANIQFHESIMQLLWRVSTILSRYVVLVTLCLSKSYYIIPFFALHYLASVVHISALQSVAVGMGTPVMEMGLILINGCIHFFAPFNMAEGRTRWRYFAAYGIEALEGLIIFTFVLTDSSFTFPYRYHFAAVAAASFTFGIVTMMVYYKCFHPRRRDNQNALSQSDGATESLTRKNKTTMTVTPKLITSEAL